MNLALETVAAAVCAEPVSASGLVTGWSVDSRNIVTGDLFFALRGPKHDGHDYVHGALERGAVAAVVERTVNGAGRLLEVPDTLAALKQLAAWVRREWGGQVIAVTGSAGKTTTKDAIAHLLASEMKVGKTAGNFNNHVGLPLSILRLPEECAVAVLEIAMNRAGEIRELAAIARPDVGVVTNVGYAHMEHFDSIDQIALAKRELIESLPAFGIAVLNADDPRVSRFKDIHRGRSVLFGVSDTAEVRAEDVEFRPDVTRFRVGEVAFETSLLGRHGLSNILAALAVARVVGIRLERLRDPVRAFAAGKMRGERLEHAGITIWNDCYNSNPEALRAMLDVLKATPAPRRIAVLGEMLELGRSAESLHRDAGRYVAEGGIEVLIGIRGAARDMVDEAVRAGMSDGAAFFFEHPAEAGEFVRQLVRPGDAVLFKGSRGVQVERALERLLT